MQSANEQRLRRYSEQSSEDLFATLESHPSGLNTAEVEAKKG